MTDWAHPIPDRHHFAYSEPQATWAIAERLEAVVQLLERIATALKTDSPA